MTDTLPTPLEAAVLQEICRQLSPQGRSALEAQIDCISVRYRKNTGAGFYTYFLMRGEPARQIYDDTKVCTVTAKINGLRDALGFILWLRDGYVDHLEGYTMALEGTSGMDLAALDFELSSPAGISN
ncbi:MAG: hypothetical protein WAL80_06745 [Xanthobacteraceae bacterium]|jgi:hypothetical protein